MVHGDDFTILGNDEELDWLDFQLKIDSALVGSPETVTIQVQRLLDFGCKHLVLFLGIPGLDFRQVKESLRLFASEVIPRVTWSNS